MRVSCIVLCVCAVAALTACAGSDTFQPAVDTTPSLAETARFLPAEAGTALEFGAALAVDGTTFVSGMPGGSGKTNKAGCVYLYGMTHGEWTLTANLVAPDGAKNDRFGATVAVSGTTVVVGALLHDHAARKCGAAYVFEYTSAGWLCVAELLPSDGAKNAEFGTAIAVSGDTVVVGAPRQGSGSAKNGAVYVFVKPASGWADMTETARLTASDAANGDLFGCAVAVSGDTVVVGASKHRFFSGGGYVYARPAAGWASATETALLSLAGGASGDELGAAVAVSDGLVVLGAPGRSALGGVVAVYTQATGGWASMTETALLAPADRKAVDRFGASVAAGADAVVAGAAGNDRAGASSGSAYLFRRPAAGWSEGGADLVFVPGDAASGAGFGTSVAVSGNVVLVGATGKDGGRGGAYLFVK